MVLGHLNTILLGDVYWELPEMLSQFHFGFVRAFGLTSGSVAIQVKFRSIAVTRDRGLIVPLHDHLPVRKEFPLLPFAGGALHPKPTRACLAQGRLLRGREAVESTRFMRGMGTVRCPIV